MNTKKMALFLLIMGLIFIGTSAILFLQKEPEIAITEIITPKTIVSKETIVEEPIHKPETPNENQEKGWAFEDFVIQQVGKLAGVKLLSQNSDYHKAGISAEENKEPDLKFSHRNVSFAVECKWRSSFYRGKIDWAKDYQVENYHRFQEQHQQKVFVALGVGGTPTLPESWYFVPLYRLTQGYATQHYIQEFEVQAPKQLLEIIKK